LIANPVTILSRISSIVVHPLFKNNNKKNK